MKRKTLAILIPLAFILCLAVGATVFLLCSCNSAKSGGGKNESGDDPNIEIIDGTEGLEYTLSDDGKYYIFSGIGSASGAEITVGNYHSGLPVTSVGDDAFRSCENIISITIPYGITDIGSYAFHFCTGLESLTVPESVKLIGAYAFSGCSSLASITIPSGITHIGSSVFSGFTGLKSITIPDGVKSIGNYAFNGCVSLKSVTINGGVESIGSSAFQNCSSLESVTIPQSVASVGIYAFRNCTNLTSVIFENSEGWAVSVNNNMTDAENIPGPDLKNPATALEYLKDTYCNYYWKRSVSPGRAH